LRHATVVRAPDGIGAFCEQGLEAAAGIRQVVSGFAARTAGFRVIEERFMQIRQAVGVTRAHAPGTVRFLAAAVEELKASGFISDALQRSGQDRSLVAPPEQPPEPPRPGHTPSGGR
jgi:polar amino acid transport system substrate-binding protein